MERDDLDLDINDELREQIQEQLEKESYELMRICRLNRIKIKNPEQWNTAKNEDFIEDCFIDRDSFIDKDTNASKQSLNIDKLAKVSENITLLTINEEVTIFEFAPRKF